MYAMPSAAPARASERGPAIRRARPRRPDTAGPTPALPAPVLPGLRPMLAAAGDLPADDGHYAFEFKWDGMRALCECNADGAGASAGGLRIVSRNGNDVTARYPELHALPRA